MIRPSEAYRARQRELAKARRDSLRARRLCINGEAHGPATHGGLCLRCRETHSGPPGELHELVVKTAAAITIDIRRRAA